MVRITNSGIVRNTAFMEAIYEYNEIVMKYGEALRLMPEFLKKFAPFS